LKTFEGEKKRKKNWKSENSSPPPTLNEKSSNKRRISYSDQNSSPKRTKMEVNQVLGGKKKKSKSEEDGDYFPLSTDEEEENKSKQDPFEFKDDKRDKDYEPMETKHEIEVFGSKRKTRNSNRLINLTEDDTDEHLGYKNLGNTCKLNIHSKSKVILIQFFVLFQIWKISQTSYRIISDWLKF
jgi:hypothetical protein